MDEDRRVSALNVDLYELTMAAAYFEGGIRQRPTFELFIRELPAARSYLLVCGLEQAVEYLCSLSFEADEVNFIRSLPEFKSVSDEFFDYLSSFRFKGDVMAMPEGTVAFAGEPLLSVTADIIEAQVVETYLLSMINFQTMVATKASRVVAAAAGRPVVDFGTRRAHGPEAGVLAARACFVGGCVATSNVEAGRRYGIPTMGTAAHSYTMAFEDEREAFEIYIRTFPGNASLLIDTYDTLEGARRAAAFGRALAGVRLDSGDLVGLSRQVRKILDDAGCGSAKIVLSGDLNEYRIAEILAAGAPADVFGVGTEMVVSRDAPSLSGVYKMVRRDEGDSGEEVIKLSPDKETCPGAKQVHRQTDGRGNYIRDVMALSDEPVPGGGHPLLERVIEGGRRLTRPVPLQEIQTRALESLERLPERYRRLQEPEPYPVELSKGLEALNRRARARASGGGC